MIFPGFVGPSYTVSSNAIADEECINWYAEKVETPGAQAALVYLPSPGLSVFHSFANGPVRAQCNTGSRYFAVVGQTLYEIASDGTPTSRGTVLNDDKPACIAFSSIQLLIVSARHAYCYTLATNALVDVTHLLAGAPVQVQFADSYFIVKFADSNKFQVSDILDGTTWPGLQVNEVSVFAENIVGIVVNHRELWVFGKYHTQVYQNTGSDEIYDVIPGVLIEKGSAAAFGAARLDNTVFWIDEDERGGRSAWRANGYTPQRISTHAVEWALTAVSDISGLVSYSYQEAGHLFWALYIPGTDCTWVYDVSTGLWAKRAEWNEATGTFGPHFSQNHCYAFGKHLVGDWNSGNIYELSSDFLDDNGVNIRRVRRSPTVVNQMEWIDFPSLTVDFANGLGPQPPLTDGAGNPRPPQAMLRWSDDRGSTWSNVHVVDCGLAGQYTARSIWWRLGRSRYRVFELSVSDPVAWTIIGAYLGDQ